MKNLKTMRDRLRFVYVWYLCYLMPNYHLNTPFTEKKSLSFSLALKYSIPQSHALFICFLKTFIEFVTIFFLGLFVVCLMFWAFCGHKICAILVPQPRIKPTGPALEGEVPPTEPPGRSSKTRFKYEHWE